MDFAPLLACNFPDEIHNDLYRCDGQLSWPKLAVAAIFFAGLPASLWCALYCSLRGSDTSAERNIARHDPPTAYFLRPVKYTCRYLATILKTARLIIFLAWCLSIVCVCACVALFSILFHPRVQSNFLLFDNVRRQRETKFEVLPGKTFSFSCFGNWRLYYSLCDLLLRYFMESVNSLCIRFVATTRPHLFPIFLESFSFSLSLET